MDHNSPEDIVIELISSRNYASSKVAIVLLLPHDTKFFLKKANINIINSLLESECSKHNLYTYNHEMQWFNAYGSLSESSFHTDNLHRVK